jgi:hypothetical protein
LHESGEDPLLVHIAESIDQERIPIVPDVMELCLVESGARAFFEEFAELYSGALFVVES